MSEKLHTNAVDSSGRGFESGFRWKIAIVSAAAYLLASVPPIFIDPLLQHHVRFGIRSYPYALWFVIPISFLILLLTPLDNFAIAMSTSFTTSSCTLPCCTLITLSRFCFTDERYQRDYIPHFRPDVWNRFDSNEHTSPIVHGLPVQGLQVRITGQLFFDASRDPCQLRSSEAKIILGNSLHLYNRSQGWNAVRVLP